MNIYLKYIKTKNAIYKTRKWLPDETMFDNKVPVYEHACIDNKDIIAQSDTIEGLCDMFCGTYKDNKDIVRWCLTLDGLDLNELTDCYGLIWTGTGFNRVAKINNKGELELL